MNEEAGADVGVPVGSNGFDNGFALSSDRIGRNGRTPVAGVDVLSAVSSERVFDSVSCLSDALILSGLRGGGSGGSDEAAIVTVPFSCIFTSGEGNSSTLLTDGSLLGSLARRKRRRTPRKQNPVKAFLLRPAESNPFFVLPEIAFCWLFSLQVI